MDEQDSRAGRWGRMWALGASVRAADLSAFQKFTISAEKKEAAIAR